MIRYRPPAPSRLRLRLIFVTVAFVVLCVAILARAVQLQVIDGRELARMARREYVKTVQLLPWRGTIYDRRGEELAASAPAASLYADPFRVADASGAAARLAAVLRLSRAGLQDALNRGSSFVWLKRLLSEEEAARVRSLSLPGLGLVAENKRYYPNGPLAGHLLGFAGTDARGLEGLEKTYEPLLAGRPASFSALRDARGRLIVPDDGQPSRGRGNNLVLTLDKTIQYIAERELAGAVEKAQAKGGVALVMDPRTGEILALANAPQFDPNLFLRSSPATWRNRAVCDSFEPGSTFKVFVLAAALEERLAKESDRFDCEGGSYRVGGNTFHDVHEHGVLNLSEVIKYSSNIGAAKLAERVGRTRLYDYIRRFGFGEPTGVDLPGETAGILRRVQGWTEPDLYTHGFGQGLTVSAMQLAAAYGAIANDGELLRPYVVKEVVSPQGAVLKRNTPTPVRRVVSAQTARRIRAMLEGVCQEGGTGTPAALPGMRVAGKTGTAQKVDSHTGRYQRGRYVASFVGFFPADTPRLLIAVVMDEPGWPYYGGLMAGPVFRAIAEQTLAYLGRPASEAPVLAGQEAPEETVRPEVVVTDEDVLMTLSAGQMADLRGMTQRRVLRLMGAARVEVEFAGSGYAASQSPAPGAPLKGRCKVTFSPS
jgi:cell division protein FtsI (penicillin-binding protein 3)